MSRRRGQDKRCRLCGQCTIRSRPLQLCFWNDGAWVWANAMLCYPCTRALSDIFGVLEAQAEVAWW
jgi:hypothetical protein